MSRDTEERLTGKRIDFIQKVKRMSAQGKTRDEMIQVLGPNNDKIVKFTGEILGSGNGPDPPDPPDPPEGRREFLQIDGMGLFLWFLLYYWDEDTRPWIRDRAIETIEEFEKYKPKSLLFFAWMRDQSIGNAHFRPMCPHPTDANGFFLLSEIKDRYLRGFEEFCVICKNAGLDIQVCFFMARYCWFPYEHNINGVTSFYDPRALPFQVNLIDSLIQIVISVYGWIREARQINEPAHGGNHHRLHVIANWTLNTFKESMIQDNVPIQGVFVDESTSAGVLIPFLEDHPCPKYNPNQPEPLCDGRIGGDLNGGSTNPADRLPVAIINHGYSILEDRGDAQNSYMGSAWPDESSWWAGGDGGTRQFSLAKGHKIHENNDPSDPRIIFAQGNGPQSKSLVKGIVGDAQNRPKKRRCGYQMTFFEILQGTPMIENCQRDQYHWDRPKGAAEGHDEGMEPST